LTRETIGNIELTREDCMELMSRYPDKHFDLAIVDPPYGIEMDGGAIGGGVLAKQAVYPKKNWDNSPPDNLYFSELRRISKQQIVWGANHFISKLPIDSSCWIVWDKQNGENNFADCEMAWTSFPLAVRKFAFRWQGMLQGDMKNKEQRIHPTQKPVALYKWLLSKYAKPGWKILDTHLGSGSHAIACYDMGFPLTASEIDGDYFDGAVERLRRFAAQGTLDFGGGE
jgi:site-specific DNA-methyltransferase (adenine-specific)